MCKEKKQSKRFKINSKVLNWYTDILLAIGKAGKFEGMQAPSTKKRTYENLSQETHDWQKTEALWNKISIGPAEASGWSCQLINLLGESAKVREKNKGCMPNACRTRRKLQRIMPPCFCKSLASINSPWLHHSPHHYRPDPSAWLEFKEYPQLLWTKHDKTRLTGCIGTVPLSGVQVGFFWPRHFIEIEIAIWYLETSRDISCLSWRKSPVQLPGQKWQVDTPVSKLKVKPCCGSASLPERATKEAFSLSHQWKCFKWCTGSNLVSRALFPPWN